MDLPELTFRVLASPLLLAERAFYWVITQEKKKPRKKFPKHAASVAAHAKRTKERERGNQEEDRQAKDSEEEAKAKVDSQEESKARSASATP